MSYVTCSHQHTFARHGNTHTPDAIDSACPRCHEGQPNHPALLATANDAIRYLTDELFYDDGMLYDLLSVIWRTNAHVVAQLRFEFERQAQMTRQGAVLSYLAQALRNDSMEVAGDEFDHLGVQPQIVVVVTLAFIGFQPTFVIGVNGHPNAFNAAKVFVDSLPQDIYGLPCIHVVEPNMHTSAQHRLGYGVSPWSWHGEQKVLGAIKEYGAEARLSTTCIGIAHRGGPCSPKTAGIGSQGCFHYLERKYDKDEKVLQQSGGLVPATVTVSAYWYALPEHANNISYYYLASIVQEQLRSYYDHAALGRIVQAYPQLDQVAGHIARYL